MGHASKIPLQIIDLMNNTVAPLNWYVKLGDDHYVLVFKARSSTSKEQMQRWLRKGITELYVNSDEFMAFASQNVSMASILVTIPDLELRQKLSTIQQANDAVVKELMGSAITHDLFLHVRSLALSVIKLLERSITLERLFSFAATSGSISTYHNLACGFTAAKVAACMGWDNPALVEKLVVGALLHDLGEKRFTAKMRSTPREKLTGADLKTYQLHPIRGHDELEGYKWVPEDILKMVIQHHECADGSGFPEGLKDEGMHLTSRILIVCEAFCTMVIKDNRREKTLSFAEAYSTLQAQAQKYNPDILERLRDVVFEAASSEAA